MRDQVREKAHSKSLSSKVFSPKKLYLDYQLEAKFQRVIECS